MKKNLIFIITCLCMINSGSLLSQDESFILADDATGLYYPAYTGNGVFSITSTKSGLAPAESYMIKVFSQGKDDIPRIANLPSWNEIKIKNGSGWLNESFDGNYIDTGEISRYSQLLDMYNGIIETSYRWSKNGHSADINTQSFISRENKNLAAVKLEIMPHSPDTFVLEFPLEERADYKRMPLAKLAVIEADTTNQWPKVWYPGFIRVSSVKASRSKTEGIMHLVSQCEGSNTKVALSAAVIPAEAEDVNITSTSGRKSGKISVSIIAEPGRKITIYKIVSAASNITDGAGYQSAAEQALKNAVSAGYNKLLEEHKEAWHRIWQTDIIAEGDPEFQKIIHSSIFYLLCSIEAGTEFSIPPMGLSSSGYYGHVFWDADTYMFPALLLMHPDMAKSAVMFRVRTLDAALENARINKYKGAMYPWEADEKGKETTPFFAYQNALKENHIVGDVALAQWQYYLATKDTAWLRENGSKVIFATADFWTSRVDYNEKLDRYEIGRLVSVNEGMKDVSNETYTNAVARINLDIAVKTSRILRTEPKPEWQKIRDRLFIPFDEKSQSHPIYENAPGGSKEATEFWTSVAPLLTYPLQMEMSKEARRNDFLHAVEGLREIGPGANMGTNFLPLIAAELGNDSLLNLTLELTYQGFLRPPFNVLAETHRNKSVNFITGAGAFLQQVIFGYTGLRITETGVMHKFKPMLPKKVKSLVLKNFTLNGNIADIHVSGSELKIIPSKK